MPKSRSRYVCQECGRQSLRHMGRCPACGQFNTMVEEMIDVAPKPNARTTALSRNLPPSAVAQRLADVSGDEGERLRIPMGEFNRVLGGGIVPGSITLLGGEPGIGKSTLLIQVSAMLAKHVGGVLYASGEESAR